MQAVQWGTVIRRSHQEFQRSARWCRLASSFQMFDFHSSSSYMIDNPYGRGMVVGVLLQSEIGII